MGSPLPSLSQPIYGGNGHWYSHTQTNTMAKVCTRHVFWTHGDSELHAFLGHLNSLKESIQFTMEEEEQRQLPFLDVLVKRKGNNLTTAVYRKPTNTDCYLNYQTNHHPPIKLGTITCLKKRAYNICSSENRRNYNICRGSLRRMATLGPSYGEFWGNRKEQKRT